ncbi:MAG: hypothetical protein GY716_02810, partial [bacterium]|nr:hypothetical protein [bacterium]
MTDKLAKTDDTALLKAAIDQGATPEALEKLLTLHERIADRKAAMEFAQKLAEFQADCPPIPKTSTARITTKSGIQYGYKYAELDTIANTVRPKLHGLGFSYSWDSAEDKGQLSVTCILRHVNGHREQSSFSCPTDSAAPVTGAQ